MLVLLLVLSVWVVLSVVAAAGFCLVLLGARSHEERRLVAVPAQRQPSPDRQPSLV